MFWPLACSRSCRLGLAKAFGGLAFDMNGHMQDRIDERRAAVLLGLPESELRRYSRASGLGHLENDDKGQKVVFTYEELRRLCLLVAQSSK